MAAHALYRRAIPSAARITRWNAPDGWEHRRFDWPAAEGGRKRGAMLFQVGRGDVFEKYLESFAHWRACGWSITSFDWRGQGGSGRLTADPHCGHIDSFDTYVDDLADFAAAWRAESEGPHVLIGHSMGGHLVLRALAEGRVAADAAVLVAPMLGLKAPVGPRFGEGAARLLARFGRATRPAWRGNERPFTRAARQTLLTSDRARYEDELWWIEANPANVAGPPSWQWLTEAFRSSRELAASPALASLDTPVLLLVAERDALVDPAAALAVADRLPRATLVRFGPEARHELLREVDAVRDHAIKEIDRFLQDVLVGA
jgi:lysophospholipase